MGIPPIVESLKKEYIMTGAERLAEQQKWFEAGIRHQSPSNKTLELFAKIEQRMDERNDKFMEMLKKLEIQIAEMPQKMFEGADKRYAGKLTENIVHGMAGLILIGVLGGVVSLVIIKGG